MGVPTGFGNYPPGVTDNDPHFWNQDERDGPEDEEPEDDWVFDCGDPDCCMNYGPHFRSECYTPEMYEAYVEECERDASQSAKFSVTDPK